MEDAWRWIAYSNPVARSLRSLFWQLFFAGTSFAYFTYLDILGANIDLTEGSAQSLVFKVLLAACTICLLVKVIGKSFEQEELELTRTKLTSKSIELEYNMAFSAIHSGCVSKEKRRLKEISPSVTVSGDTFKQYLDANEKIHFIQDEIRKF